MRFASSHSHTILRAEDVHADTLMDGWMDGWTDKERGEESAVKGSRRLEEGSTISPALSWC